MAEIMTILLMLHLFEIEITVSNCNSVFSSGNLDQ